MVGHEPLCAKYQSDIAVLGGLPEGPGLSGGILAAQATVRKQKRRASGAGTAKMPRLNPGGRTGRREAYSSRTFFLKS